MEHPPTNGPDHEEPVHEQPRHIEPPAEVPFDGTPLEQVSAFLRIAFAEADARGEVISTEDAQAVASMLAALLGASEMRRFAEARDGNILALQTECHYLKSRAWETPDVDLWVERFEQYLAERDEPTK